MDIREIRESKIILIDSIRRLCMDFEKKTTLEIENISIDRLRAIDKNLDHLVIDIELSL